MKVIMGDPVRVKAPKDRYVVEVDTMEGDADGWNQFESQRYKHSELDMLKQYIIYCEVLLKQYPHGRGGSDDHQELPFFEEEFNDYWPCSCDGQFEDSMEGYSVFYYDKTGQKFEVNIELDDKDKEEIKSYGVLTY